MKYNILFVQFDHVDCTEKEIKAFKEIVELKNFKFIHKLVSDRGSFKNALQISGVKYLILAGHANQNGIGTLEDEFTISWEDVGQDICDSGCFSMMVGGANLLLWCCKGGVKSVACTLMNICAKLNFLAGPIHQELSINLFGLFLLFIYNFSIYFFYLLFIVIIFIIFINYTYNLTAYSHCYYRE